MSYLTQIHAQLADAHALIAKWESHLTKPDAPDSIRANIRSLERRCEDLERELTAEAARRGVEVCRYRLFDCDEKQPRAAAIGGALQSFQKALTTVFDAQAAGPKDRARTALSAVEHTALEFGYAFHGSAGFVFTVDSERMLIDELPTKLEDAVDTLFAIASAKSSAEVGKFVTKVGHGGIRAVQSWVKSHSTNGLGSAIQWIRSQRVCASMHMQAKDWAALAKAIDETSEETTIELQVIGELYAVDLKTHRFMMRVEGAGEIHGTFTDAISDSHRAELPQTYRAILDETTRIHYSLQENEIRYFLKNLEPA